MGEPPPSTTFFSLVTHDFACTSCKEVGSTANPVARDMITEKTAAIKTDVLLKAIKQNKRLCV
jgi:hypothetical protein